MSYYRDMYYRLFNAFTDAIESIELENYDYAKDLLIQAQQDTEEMFIEAYAEEEDTREALLERHQNFMLDRRKWIKLELESNEDRAAFEKALAEREVI